MSDVLEAAIEVTTTKSIPPIEDAFGSGFVSVPRNAWLSAVAVACLYRGEHPADDGFAVDEEWLRAVGFTPNRDGYLCCPGAESLQWIGGNLLYDNPDKGWHDMPTRGHARRLLAALGISLTE